MLRTLAAMHLISALVLLLALSVAGDSYIICVVVSGFWAVLNWAGFFLTYPIISSLPAFEENFIPDAIGVALVAAPTFVAFCFNALVCHVVLRAKGKKGRT